MREIARPRKQRPAAAMRELSAFARTHEAKRKRLEAQQAKLRAERDAAVIKAYRAGIPLVDIAAALSLSHQRVSELVRQG